MKRLAFALCLIAHATISLGCAHGTNKEAVISDGFMIQIEGGKRYRFGPWDVLTSGPGFVNSGIKSAKFLYQHHSYGKAHLGNTPKWKLPEKSDITNVAKLCARPIFKEHPACVCAWTRDKAKGTALGEQWFALKTPRDREKEVPFVTALDETAACGILFVDTAYKHSGATAQTRSPAELPKIEPPKDKLEAAEDELDQFEKELEELDDGSE